MIGRIFLGRYETQKLLGEGGMGKVYLARQTDLNRQVVVKVMHEHVATDPKFRERFQRETLVMARFQHPNAVTLYDASLTDEYGSCIIMEYVKGVNLESLLQKNGRLTFGRVARVVPQLCDVLQAAHDQGILHRDLKPANIMICDPETPRERVKVMDFGLAKLVDDGEAKQVTDTSVDFAVGTPGYIAPEQVRGQQMDHRGDLYSIGIMLYELLTGRLPYQGATSMDVLLAHATESPPKFSELGLGRIAPKAVEEVVRWCLEKDPDARPQSARELADGFMKAVSRSSTGSTESGLYPPAKGVSEGTDENPIVLVAMGSPAPPVAKTSRDSRTGSNATVETPAMTLNKTPLPRHKSPPSLPPLVREGHLFQLDAWMPESIAFMKLRGFIQDVGGVVVDARSGYIRVKFEKIGVKAPGNAPLAWLGLGKKSDGPAELVLEMKKTNPQKEPNRISITAAFQPQQSALLHDDAWQQRCAEIFVNLRAFLMG